MHQREDRLRGGAGGVVRRTTVADGHEARGAERRRRPVHELGARVDPRRAGGCRGRRPGNAQLAERAGLSLLRRFRANHLSRAGHATGGLRPDAHGLRPLGAFPGAGAGAAGDAAGAQPGRRARRRRASREPGRQGAGAGVVDAAARKCAQAVARSPRTPAGDRRVVGALGRQPAGAAGRGDRPGRDHHRDRAELLPRESGGGRPPVVPPPSRRVPDPGRARASPGAPCRAGTGARGRLPVRGAPAPRSPAFRRGDPGQGNRGGASRRRADA